MELPVVKTIRTVDIVGDREFKPSFQRDGVFGADFLAPPPPRGSIGAVSGAAARFEPLLQSPRASPRASPRL